MRHANLYRGFRRCSLGGLSKLAKRSSFRRRRTNRQAAHLVEERGAGNPKAVCRIVNPPIEALQREPNMSALCLLANLAERAERFDGRGRLGGSAEQGVGPDPRAVRQGDGALDPIAEFADIAEPRMI
jgi:hypothetical protein